MLSDSRFRTAAWAAVLLFCSTAASAAAGRGPLLYARLDGCSAGAGVLDACGERFDASSSLASSLYRPPTVRPGREHFIIRAANFFIDSFHHVDFASVRLKLKIILK